MNRSSIRCAFVLAALVALSWHIVGCSSNDRNPLSNLSAAFQSAATTNGAASVRMSFRLDGYDSRASVITASGSASPTVTCTLLTFDYVANPATLTMLATTVPVSLDGVATASFDNVPVLPTLAKVQINGGVIATYSRFRGGADLVAGPNAIVVHPENSGLQGDLVGYALEKIASSSSYLALVRGGLVAVIKLRTTLQRGYSVASVCADLDQSIYPLLTNLANNSNTTMATSTSHDLGGGVSLQMNLIPSGQFRMGQASIGIPVTTVTLTRPFYCGIYEVTQAQYARITNKWPSRFFPVGLDSLGYTTSTLPVEKVSWYDAIEFCNILSSQTGLVPVYLVDKGTRDPNNLNSNTADPKWTVVCDWNANGFRLPTEAEWEYACRAGTTSTYYWGEDASADTLKQHMWFAWNSYNLSWTDPHAAISGTQPVAGKSPNPWGLYDMGGNVYQWCWDLDNIPYQPPSSAIDPTGTTTGFGRVVRGLGWQYYNAGQSASRGPSGPETKYEAIGFRVVRSVTNSR